MGDHTAEVPMELFKLNRQRLSQRLQEKKEIPKNSVVLLQGGSEAMRYCTDVEFAPFRQVKAVSIKENTLYSCQLTAVTWNNNFGHSDV